MRRAVGVLLPELSSVSRQIGKEGACACRQCRTSEGASVIDQDRLCISLPEGLLEYVKETFDTQKMLFTWIDVDALGNP